MKLTMPSQVNTAIKMLSDNGFEGYAVGGCVRDMVMGKVPCDYDITTSALPEETEKVFEGFHLIETGIQHGTVTVIVDDMPLEITTYRIDGNYTDNRHPESVAFTRSLKDDLSRRDFTINTLCYNESEGIIDLFGGAKDIESETIRTVGNADLRFSEDALRIIRGLRFAATLGFTIENKTAQSIIKNKELLGNIAAERLRVEFQKLICGKNAFEILKDYHSVIEVFIPELKCLVGCEQLTPYHKYDVFMHTLYALNSIESTPLLRLVMLFHDFGKPYVKTTDEKGINHFKTHAVKSKEIAFEILKRLKYDTKTVNIVSFLVGIHDRKSAKTKIEAKKLLCEIGCENYINLIKIKRADNRAKANPHAIDEKLRNMQLFYDEIIKNNECFSLKQLAVSGDDLKAVGITDGLKIHKTLDYLLGEVIEERCANGKDLLLKKAGEYNDNQKSGN